jgi:hypothetical protein
LIRSKTLKQSQELSSENPYGYEELFNSMFNWYMTSEKSKIHEQEIEKNSFKKDRVRVLKNLDPAEIVNSLILLNKTAGDLSANMKKLEFKVNSLDEIGLDIKCDLHENSLNNDLMKNLDSSKQEMKRNSSYTSEKYEKIILRQECEIASIESPKMSGTYVKFKSGNPKKQGTNFEISKIKTKHVSRDFNWDSEDHSEDKKNFKNEINSINNILSAEMDKLIHEAQQDYVPRENRNAGEKIDDEMRVGNKNAERINSPEFDI